MWRRAWVNTLDQYEPRWPEPYRLIQNRGTGFLIQGCRDWMDYRVTASFIPHLVRRTGLAARVQGVRRYYAFLLAEGGKVQLVKVIDGESMLAEREFPWELDHPYTLTLEVAGASLRGRINDVLLVDVFDDTPFHGGAVALVCQEGCASVDAVTVSPLQATSI